MKFTPKISVFLLLVLVVMSLAACGEQNIGQTTLPTEPTLNMGSADCSHVWLDWEQSKQSTCTEQGTMLRACSLCGKQEKKQTPIVGHYYNDGICAACGSSAPNCQHQSTEHIVIKEATCTQSGQTNILCAICHAVLSVEEHTPNGHMELTCVELWAPTCIQSGRVNLVCAICGAVAGYEVIPALGHTDTEWVVLQEPTCSQDGHRQRICNICKMVVEESYPGYLGHSYHSVSAQQPTCTQDGWEQYRYCDVCDYSELEMNRIPAYGHRYLAGVCGKCGATDAAFEKGNVPGLPNTEYTVPVPEEPVLQAHGAQILQYTVPIMVAAEKTTYSLTPSSTVVYSFWVTGLYNGNTLKMYIKDDLGQSILEDTNLANEEYCGRVILQAGKTYIVEVVTRTCVKPGQFQLNIGCQGAVSDISDNSAVVDSMDFSMQTNRYTFTPGVDGIYRMWLSGMTSGFSVDVSVYDVLGYSVLYAPDCGNDAQLALHNLVAGQQYTIEVTYRSGSGAYTLHLGKQQPVVDISQYSVIHDRLYYAEQVNLYRLTVSADGIYNLVLRNLPEDVTLRLKVFNEAGDRVTFVNVSSCNYGSGVELKAGMTYTIQISSEASATDYTLCVYAEKPVVELKKNSGLVDAFEYNDQVNTYTFTATEGGSYRIAITGLPDNVTVEAYVYDANGVEVAFRPYLRNGMEIELENLAPGASFIIRVRASGRMTTYMISLQQ